MILVGGGVQKQCALAETHSILYSYTYMNWRALRCVLHCTDSARSSAKLR